MTEAEKIMQEIIPLMHRLSEVSPSGTFSTGNGEVKYDFSHKFSEWSELPVEEQ